MKIEIKRGSELTKSFKKIYINALKKEFNCGPEEDYSKDTFFIVKDKNKFVSFGVLTPVSINYKGTKYNILGITEMISIVKKKGYGKAMVNAMKDYLTKKRKTGVGFCGHGVSSFYDKAGLKTKEKLARRFFYDYGGEKKNFRKRDLDVVYWEGKDKFITKVLKTKSLVNLPYEHW
jgi:hypothetical protein